MDVSCERCKAEYEFDDSLLGEHGTTVKCSTCGHVFRVLPSSKEPTRPSLKLRYVRDGRIVPLSSLRDLQRRVHTGEVGLNDELGRDGFPWRKLSEVPELRGFFLKPTATSSSSPQPAVDPARRPSALSVSLTSMPAAKDGTPGGDRTLSGMGPENPQIPGPPRMPSVPGVASIPTPGAARPGGGTSTQAPRVQAAASASAARTTSDSDRPTDPPMRNASARPRSLAPAGAPSNPVSKLYLSEHEAPPARATESSSRIWVAAAVALALVVGGAVIATAMGKKDADPAPTAPPAGRIEAPTPSAAIAPEPAPTEGAPPALPTPTPSPNTPAPVVAAAVEPVRMDDAAKAGVKTSGMGKAREGAVEATPTDYGSWVAKGDADVGRSDPAAAEKSYTQALALRASGSEAATGLGYALLGQGKAREAIPYFERAAKNGYAEASIGLGDAHKKLGNSDAARRAYQNYIERLPSGSRTAYVEKQLASMGVVGSGRPVGAGVEAPDTERPEPEPSAPGPEPEYRPAGELTLPAGSAADEAAP